MSDKREAIEVNTSENAKLNKNKEPGLPVTIPMSIVRWLSYSLFMLALLFPAFWEGDAKVAISLALILGHFASQLNALINKKP